jgi:putative transposase
MQSFMESNKPILFHQSNLGKYRISFPGALYSITKSLNISIHSFVKLDSDVCGNILIEELFRFQQTGNFNLIAFVVMPDHLHFICGLPDHPNIIPLNKLMNLYFGRTARNINLALKREGSLWHHGFYDHRIRSQTDLINQIRYIEENPVRKKLVSKPEEWLYSSAYPQYKNSIKLDWLFETIF